MAIYNSTTKTATWRRYVQDHIDSSGGGGSGVWVQISDNTPTAAGTLSYTWDESLYSQIQIVIEGLRVGTDNTHVTMRLTHTNGTTQGALNYLVTHVDWYAGAIATVLAGDTTSIYLTQNTADGGAFSQGVGNSTGIDMNAEFVFTGMASTTIGAMFRGMSKYEESGTDPIQKSFISGAVGETNSGADPYGIYAYDGVDIIASTGVFVAAGSIKIYGLTV